MDESQGTSIIEIVELEKLNLISLEHLRGCLIFLNMGVARSGDTMLLCGATLVLNLSY